MNYFDFNKGCFNPDDNSGFPVHEDSELFMKLCESIGRKCVYMQKGDDDVEIIYAPDEFHDWNGKNWVNNSTKRELAQKEQAKLELMRAKENLNTPQTALLDDSEVSQKLSDRYFENILLAKLGFELYGASSSQYLLLQTGEIKKVNYTEFKEFTKAILDERNAQLELLMNAEI